MLVATRFFERSSPTETNVPSWDLTFVLEALCGPSFEPTESPIVHNSLLTVSGLYYAQMPRIDLRLFLQLIDLWNLSFRVSAEEVHSLCPVCLIWTAPRMCIYVASCLPALLIQLGVELCLNRSSPTGLWRLSPWHTALKVPLCLRV